MSYCFISPLTVMVLRLMTKSMLKQMREDIAVRRDDFLKYYTGTLLLIKGPENTIWF
jgi:hypothetical protein